jgi:hypothetical protein
MTVFRVEGRFQVSSTFRLRSFHRTTQLTCRGVTEDGLAVAEAGDPVERGQPPELPLGPRQ